MKKIKITVRWFDGFKRDFFPIDYKVGTSHLWLKFENKEEWIPYMSGVRNVNVEEVEK